MAGESSRTPLGFRALPDCELNLATRCEGDCAALQMRSFFELVLTFCDRAGFSLIPASACAN